MHQFCVRVHIGQNWFNINDFLLQSSIGRLVEIANIYLNLMQLDFIDELKIIINILHTHWLLYYYYCGDDDDDD